MSAWPRILAIALTVLSAAGAARADEETGASIQLPPLPSPAAAERAKSTAQLPLRGRKDIESVQATRRTTEEQLQRIGTFVERVRKQIDELANSEEPGAKEKQADLTTSLDTAREAETQCRDTIRLQEDVLALEDEKRQANDERKKRLDEEAALGQLTGGEGRAFTLEQADQAKSHLALAQDRQRLVQAKAESLKAEEEGLERAQADAAALLTRREIDLTEIRARLAQERQRGGTPDELAFLQNVHKITELRRGQARDRVQHLAARGKFLEERRALVEFGLETAILDVATAQRRAEYIAAHASVSNEDVDASGEKLLAHEQERQRRLARAEEAARKADAERAAAVDRKLAAEDELAKARRDPDREVARAKVELASLTVAAADVRKRIAEAQIAAANADFERARETIGYYATMRDIRTNTVSNTELEERRREVRASLKGVVARLGAAQRQTEEVRASRRVLEGQTASLEARLGALDAARERVLGPPLREQQKALQRLVEAKEEHVTQLAGLASTLHETRKFLSELDRRVDRELGISRIWERKPSAFAPENLRHALSDLGEIRTGLAATLAYARQRAPEIVRATVTLQTLTLLLVTALLAYLDVALVLWLRRRLAWAQGPEAPGVGPEQRRATARVMRAAAPWAGALAIAAVATLWLPEALGGLAMLVAGGALAAVAGTAALDEALAPWSAEARLVRCTDHAARHVHAHLRRILWLSAVVLPVIHALPLVFHAVGRPPRTALIDLLWVVYKIGMAVEIGVLAWPRELVLSLLPQSGSAMAAMAAGTLRLLYPVVTLFVLSLFTLGAVGYVDLARFLSAATAQTLLAVGGAFGAHAVLRRALNALLLRADPETAPGEPAAEPSEEHLASIALVTGTLRLARYAMGLSVLVALYFVWGGDPEGLQTINRYLRAQMAFGPFVLSPMALAQAILTVYVSLLASRYLRRFLEVAVYPSADFDTGLQHAVSTALHYFVMAMGLSYAMETLGIGMDYVKWFVGAIGVGAGFGLQHIVYNVISGIIVLIERPVKMGDWIEIGGVFGRVEKISIRSTTVCNTDNIEVIIPNSELVSQKLSNWTYSNPVTRLRTSVRVAYGTDTEVMRRLLLDCARANANILANPPPQALLRTLGEHALEWELSAACKEPGMRPQTLSELNLAIEKAIRKARIAIPTNISHQWEPEPSPPLAVRQADRS